MKSLLCGNGINIQFGGNENTNASIIIRAIKETKKADYPTHIIIDDGELLLYLLGQLFLHIKMILNDEMDVYAVTKNEQIELERFKERYNCYDSINIANIGFEDYYFVYDLFCYKYKIQNPDKYYVRESLKAFFIYSIFNKGLVNQNYVNFPNKLNKFFEQFDNIFTTNYDNNLEQFSNKKVQYLHGAFHIKKGIYSPDSIRNQLEDHPIDNTEIDDDFYYLYSNALTTYSGDYKKHFMTEASTANKVLERMAKGYLEDKTVKNDIDSWKTDPNELVRKLGNAISIKVNNPILEFPETYPTKEFESIVDHLSIIGLSPDNDSHVFELINNNPNFEEVLYYYHDASDIETVKLLLPNVKINFEEVVNLWKEYED